MREADDPSPKLGAAGRWLLVAAVALTGFGLGGVHTTVLGVATCFGLAALLLLSWRAPALELRNDARILVAVGVGLTAWSALQAVPMPTSLLRMLAADNADVWARCLSPFGENGPGWAPLSLDPSATRVQVLRGIAYLVVLLSALRVARAPEGVTFLQRVVVVLSSLMALAAFVHPLVGAQRVFGIYEPEQTHAYDPSHLAPLLNTNHLAAYVNIGLLAAFECVLSSRAAVPRPIALVLVVLLGATTAYTISRGGLGSMVLGLLVVAAMKFGARRRPGRPFRSLIAATVGVGAFTVFLLATFDATRTKLLNNNLFKVELTKNALELVHSHELFGIGRGAFESTFPSVRHDFEYFVYTNPEDLLAQWVTEWGVPVAIAGFLAIAWALRPSVILNRSRPPVGAWAAIVAVSVQNLVDYNLELPGVVLLLTLCAATVSGGRRDASDARKVNRIGAPMHQAVALACVGIVTTGLAIADSGHELYNEQRSFRDEVLDETVPRERFVADIRGAMLRHPAEPYFPFIGAVHAITHGESVIPWAERALERSPVFGRMHLLLARAFVRRSPAQARLEYRYACMQDGTVCIRDEIIPLVGGYDDATEIVPDGRRGREVLEFLIAQLQSRLPATAVRLDEDLRVRDASAQMPSIRAARAAISDLRDHASWCEGPLQSECLRSGLVAADRVIAAMPTECSGYALKAELEIAGEQRNDGLKLLQEAIEHVDAPTKCAQELVRLAIVTGDRDEIESSLDRLLKMGCSMEAECVDNLLYAAKAEASSGNRRRALILYRRAFERAPERDDLLITIGERAEADEFHGTALEAYQMLQARHPEDARWTRCVARERAAIARGLAGHD